VPRGEPLGTAATLYYYDASIKIIIYLSGTKQNTTNMTASNACSHYT